MNEELKKLYDKKGKIVADMEGIAKRVKVEGKAMTEEERSNLRNWSKQITELDQQIEDEKLLQSLEATRGVKEGRRITENDDNRHEDDIIEERRNPNFDFTIAKKAEAKHGPITEWRLRNFDVNEKMQRADVYQVLAALHPMADKKTFSTATKYALDECRGATSNALLTEYLSAQLLDGGLAKSRLSQAGMRVQVMEERTKRFAKITTYPTFTWEAEQATTTDKTVVFDSVDFESKTLRGFVTIPGETAQDCHNIDSALRAIFRRSIGNSIDYAGLFGAAASATEPEGIYNYTNVNRHDLSAVPTSYDAFLDASKLVLDDNGEVPSTSIISPGSWVLFNKLKGGDNSPLPMPLIMAMQNNGKGHRFLETTQIPDDLGDVLNTSCIFMGGFDSVNLGVRLETQVTITPLEAAKYQWNYFTVFRGDIQAFRQEDLAVIDNIWLAEHT